jgi:hypothetical protein
MDREMVTKKQTEQRKYTKSNIQAAWERQGPGQHWHQIGTITWGVLRNGR